MNKFKNFIDEYGGILCVILATIIICVGLLVYYFTEYNTPPTPHEFITTTIIEKDKNEGFAGYPYYKDTEYYLVSEYYMDEKRHTVTTYVSIDVYNYYNIGDKLLYCKTHNRLKIYES